MTVSLLEEKGFDPLSYRYFCLGSHYRRNLVFSFENLANAQAAYQKLIARVAALKPEGEPDTEAMVPLRQNFQDALGNDLNTSLALTQLSNALKAKVSDATKQALVAQFDRVLSLDLIKKAEEMREKQRRENEGEEITPELQALLDARAAARAEKNWAEADRIRDEFKARGLVVVDTPQGVKIKKL